MTPLMHSRIRQLPISNFVKDKGIAIWKLDTESTDFIDDDMGLLSDDEQHRSDQFKHEVNRRRFVLGRSILRRLLGEKLECSPKNIELSYSKTGLPEISHPLTSLQFSVSHSDDMTLFALADRTPIGIDIERHDRSIDPLKIAENIFSRREIKRLLSCDEPLRSELFYRIWTIKESLLKMLGTGFSIDPSALCVEHLLSQENTLKPQSEIGIEYIESVMNEGNSFPEKANILELPIGSQYIAALTFGLL